MDIWNQKVGLHTVFLVAIALVFISQFSVSVGAGSGAKEFGSSLFEEMGDDLLSYSGTSDGLVISKKYWIHVFYLLVHIF